MGLPYGIDCENESKVNIGIYLNMLRGQLSFSINGKFYGVAFENDELKSGPYFVGVSIREGGEARFVKRLNNVDELLY